MLAAACAALSGESSVPMPWLAPYRLLGHCVARQVMAGRTVVQALNSALPSPAAGTGVVNADGSTGLRFVAQRELPMGEAYESFVARTGSVPTREHPHDLFNGLVWLRFGALKRQLNHLHVQQLERAGNGPARGALRDALTLFDENAALLHAPPVLTDALRRRDWTALFATHRAAWADATLTLFGHALLEKLLQPRKAITAHVRLVSPLVLGAMQVEPSSPDALWLGLAEPAGAGLLGRLIEQSHLPLPVLGVPGWWAANEDGNFYRDEVVFRPARQSWGEAARKVIGDGL